MEGAVPEGSTAGDGLGEATTGATGRGRLRVIADGGGGCARRAMGSGPQGRQVTAVPRLAGAGLA